MVAVTVHNLGKVPVSFDLYHALYCEISRDCHCDVQRVLRPVPQKNGDVKSQYDRVVSPRAIYLAPGESAQVHPAVMRLQPVKDLVARGLLEVKTVEITPPPAAPPPATKTGKSRKAPKAPPVAASTTVVSEGKPEGVKSEDL